MKSVCHFRDNFGVHYDEFELGRLFTDFKESSAKLNLEGSQLCHSDDSVHCVVEDFNKKENLRGRLYEHVLKT